jgi:outer membrane protein
MNSKFISALSIAAMLTAGAFAQAADTNAATAASTTSNAVVAGPTKVAIINIQAAIANTNEGQRDLEALQKKFEPKQLELKSLNDEVDNLKKQLAAQTDKLNDEEKTRRVQAIESKQKSLQRSLEDAQNDYQQQSNEIAQRIGTKLMQSLDGYAKQNRYAVVIDVSSEQTPVLWRSPSVDITKPVIDAYNIVSGVPAPAAPRASAPAPTSGAVGAPHRPATTGTGAPAVAKPASSTPASTTPK